MDDALAIWHPQANGAIGVFWAPWDFDVLDSAATVGQPPASSLTRPGPGCCSLTSSKPSLEFLFARATPRRERLQWDGLS